MKKLIGYLKKLIYKGLEMAKVKSMTELEKMKLEAAEIVKEAKRRERQILQKIKEEEAQIFSEVGKKAVALFNKKINEDEFKSLLKKYNLLDEFDEVETKSDEKVLHDGVESEDEGTYNGL